MRGRHACARCESGESPKQTRRPNFCFETPPLPSPQSPNPLTALGFSARAKLSSRSAVSRSRSSLSCGGLEGEEDASATRVRSSSDPRRKVSRLRDSWPSSAPAPSPSRPAFIPSPHLSFRLLRQLLSSSSPGSGTGGGQAGRSLLHGSTRQLRRPIGRSRRRRPLLAASALQGRNVRFTRSRRGCGCGRFHHESAARRGELHSKQRDVCRGNLRAAHNSPLTGGPPCRETHETVALGASSGQAGGGRGAARAHARATRGLGV